MHLIVDVDRYLVALDNQRVDGAGIVPRSGGRRDGAVARVSHHVCLDLLHQRRHPARGEQPRRARRAAAAARLGEHVDVAIVVVLFLVVIIDDVVVGSGAVPRPVPSESILVGFAMPPTLCYLILQQGTDIFLESQLVDLMWGTRQWQ